MKNNNKFIVILTSILILLAGLLFGLSITTFGIYILNLPSASSALIIVSYVTILIFIVLIVVIMRLLETYKSIIFKNKDEKKDLDYEEK